MIENKGYDNQKNNQSEIVVQDVSKYSEGISSQESQAKLNREWGNESQDNLETESEAASVQKVTSNPQGPSSAEPNLNVPMTPRKALQMFSDVLTDFEQSEMLNSTIYFIGPKADKIKGSLLSDNNFGYDDDKGDYKITLKDHIDYRYEQIRLLGQGSFGQVIEWYDHKKKEKCALKIIRNRKKFHDQALVEVKVLKTLRENDPNDEKNVIRIFRHFTFRNHICITTELLSINMYELVKDHNFEGFPMETVRGYAIQILQSLKYMRNMSIIHWDLKPENILVKDKTNKQLKVIDFGSSCFNDERIYTYIQSRFYRAPEIILGIPYTNAIDMWSFACIIVELYIGFPIFPGVSENDQLARIMEFKGAPPINVMEESTRSGYFFDDNLDPLPVKNSRGGIRKPCTKSLTQFLDWNDKNFIRFLDSWLHWDPELRLTPEEALCHDWIHEGLHTTQPLHYHHRMLNSQYQSSPDIESRKLIQNHQLEQILQFEENEVEKCDQTRSMHTKNINSPKTGGNSNFKMNTQKIQFQNFMDELKRSTLNHTNKLKVDTEEKFPIHQIEDDDEIRKLAQQMNNLENFNKKKWE